MCVCGHVDRTCRVPPHPMMRCCAYRGSVRRTEPGVVLTVSKIKERSLQRACLLQLKLSRAERTARERYDTGDGFQNWRDIFFLACTP